MIQIVDMIIYAADIAILVYLTILVIGGNHE